METNKEIYLDHASTTFTDEKVLKAMMPFLTENFGNAKSIHEKGFTAKKAINDARKTIAKFLNCDSSEIIFTGSGTESNNIGIIGTARANKHLGNHLITTKIEHSSVRKVFEYLEEEGFQVTYLEVEKNGILNPKALQNAITDKTTLVSIMHANNEIGSIQPIKECGEICKKNNIIFHVDACQTALYLDLNVQKNNIDLLTLNGSKIHGPKGVGALFIRRETKINPIMFGGNHEQKLRPGTQATANIVGLAEAVKIIKKTNKTKELRDKLINEVLQIDDISLNGDRIQRLDNNINISIKGFNAQEILQHLDAEDIYVSSGSACGNRLKNPSETLKAIGLSKKEINSSLRISLGKSNTTTDIEKFLIVFKKILKQIKDSRFTNLSHHHHQIPHH